jgi:hypothetical protein
LTNSTGSSYLTHPGAREGRGNLPGNYAVDFAATIGSELTDGQPLHED